MVSIMDETSGQIYSDPVRKYVYPWARIVSCFLVLWLGLVLLSLSSSVFLDQPRFDGETVALFHQHESMESDSPADLLLVGDSSCMMGVDAPALSERLGGLSKSLNLGLIIGLSAKTYAEAVRTKIDNARVFPKVLILLISPAKLAEDQRNPWFEDLWQSFAISHSSIEASPFEFVRERLMGRLFSQSLKGNGAWEYGFTSVIWDYLEAHHGSAIDGGEFRWKGKGEGRSFKVLSTLEGEYLDFQSIIGEQVPLFVGLTPMPETYVGDSFEADREHMLATLSKWMPTAHILANLPATLPGGVFATPTHLNEQGQRVFTRYLAEILRREDLGL